MKNLAIKSPLPALGRWLHVARLYLGVFVFLLLAGVYGFIVLQINTLSNPVVDNSAVLSEAKSSPTPRIDDEAAKQLEALKDNSVNVQTLFEQGRTNPFEE